MGRGKILAAVVALAMLVLAAAAGKWVRQEGVTELSYQDFFPQHSPQQGSKKPLRMGMLQMPQTLDPARISDRTGRVLGANIYEGLVGLNPDDLTPVPALAKSWEISRDGKVYTFSLQRGVKFTSGRELTAEEVKRSWERVLDPSLNSDLTYLMLPIKGARERIEGRAAAVEGIEAAGKYKLRVVLEQPNAGFLSRLAMPPFWVLDVEAAKEYGNKFGGPGTVSAGTGPFLLQEWKGQKIYLAAHAAYWSTPPRLQGAVCTFFADGETALKAFRAGELDYLDEVPLDKLEGLKKDPGLAPMLRSYGLLDSYFYQFNLQNPLWGASPALRQAVNLALDKEALAAKLFGDSAVPLAGLVPVSLQGYRSSAHPYGYDKEKAKQLLAAAGYPGGQGLPALEIAFNDLPAHQAVAEAVKEQLKEAGIKALLRPVPWEEYKKALAEGKYACFRGGWSWDYPDPDDLFFYNFHSSQLAATNYCFYSKPAVDSLLAAARTETSRAEKRMEYYREAEKIITEDAPLVWLFAWRRVVLASPLVEGLRVNALDIVQLKDAAIKET